MLESISNLVCLPQLRFRWLFFPSFPPFPCLPLGQDLWVFALLIPSSLPPEFGGRSRELRAVSSGVACKFSPVYPRSPISLITLPARESVYDGVAAAVLAEAHQETRMTVRSWLQTVWGVFSFPYRLPWGCVEHTFYKLSIQLCYYFLHTRFLFLLFSFFLPLNFDFD